jgi:hypothetical protein
MNIRPRLSYANVAATIALFLAIGGGTVYAAAQLGKNDVRSRNLAPGAVKTSDIGKNAVTSAKIRNGTVRGADIAAGVIQSDVADVTGSAGGGGQSIPPDGSPVAVPLTGTTTFTPQAGQVSALAAEGQFAVATTNSANDCRPFVGLLINNQPTRVFLAPDPNGPPYSTTLETLIGYDADGPFGLISPGTPLTISALLGGDNGNNCTADSKLNRLEIRIVQIR